MKSNHHPEHRTYPAVKMIPVEVIHTTFFTWESPGTGRRFAELNRILKKVHTRRSRQYLKRQLRRQVVGLTMAHE